MSTRNLRPFQERSSSCGGSGGWPEARGCSRAGTAPSGRSGRRCARPSRWPGPAGRWGWRRGLRSDRTCFSPLWLPGTCGRRRTSRAGKSAILAWPWQDFVLLVFEVSQKGGGCGFLPTHLRGRRLAPRFGLLGGLRIDGLGREVQAARNGSNTEQPRFARMRGLLGRESTTYFSGTTAMCTGASFL